ncbi:MAG TPA: methionine synthase [Tepidisphaeraceae bacterium]|nr:methionine synthase [Tepidisphaeraceae bacterium]
MSVRPTFLQLVRQRVVFLDGAMGTSIHTYNLDLQKDYLGHENCTEILIETRPDVIREIHESFLAVGCDAVETDTFNGNKVSLSEYGIADKVFALNKRGAEIAREACDKFETPDRPRYVIGSIGPSTKMPSVGFTTYDILEDAYAEQCRGLLAGGVDAFLIETAFDLLQVKAAISACNIAMKEAGKRIPIMVQVTILEQGSMLAGSDISAVVAAMLPFDEVDVLGMNCALGPDLMGEHLAYLSHHYPKLLSVLPNAGLPTRDKDGKTCFPLTPQDFARWMLRFVNDHGVNIVGGCCGTTPTHLKALIDTIGHREPKKRDPIVKPQVASLFTAEELRQDTSYLIVAERTNTNGSRQFKRLLQENNWDGLVAMAKDEVKDGSHVLDVCVDFVGRNGVADMHEVIKRYVGQVKAPIMLDSTDPKVMEAGLKLHGGRCILNSMNLEDGEERIAHICALAKKYGAAVVAGTIDEDKQNAMARTAARKISIAKRIRDLANKYGLKDQDILFDPLVLPISTGIEEDRRNALETIEGTRQISQQLPDCHTVVGLSNVSFGLKPAARVVLNSAFLHELRDAGLTSAIVHASKILPQNRIPPEQWNAALDLIYDRRREGFDPLTHFIDLFPEGAETAITKVETESLPLEEQLKRHIIDGEKRNLIEHLTEALKKYSPLDIINNFLLDGMKVVGELFGSGQMQLPFVLQSAETMKAAVAHLEPFMEKVEGQSKGKIILATVKGDVHDIGKNLVDIILTNNGYTVYNLGIKVPITTILQEFRDKKADAIGMSGLLVKSVGVMKENLEEMNVLGVRAPVLLGGAALTRDYAEGDLAELYSGPLLYCRDAFDGLHIMDKIADGQLTKVIDEQQKRTLRRRELAEKAVKPQSLDAADIKPINRDNPIPTPPFWGRRVVKDLNPRHIFPYINETALFVGQWGLRKMAMNDEDYHRMIAEKARPVFDALQKRAVDERLLEPKVVYGFFPVQSNGEDLIVYRTDEFVGPMGEPLIMPKATPHELLRFSFPRQVGRRRLCISDFFRSHDSGQFDVLAIQLVTVGDRATEMAEKLRKEDKYQDYLFLHGFGVESAEALAEFWHKRIRQELGFSSEDSDKISDLFHQKYRGSRYSFGYPACPNLEDRALIVQLLQPRDINVALNENHMLVPEQSTDALIAHHPQAKYFDV